MNNPTYIFLDTNIFIHFKNFEEINWKHELGLNNEFEIVLAPIIIDELDKHKYNQNQKISRRVKKLLPRIENMIIEKRITLITKRPFNSTFEYYNLDKSEQDDCLLATILEFKENERDVIYITNDTGPRLKAGTLNIKSKKINENLIIDNDDDEVIKENKKLKNEINEIKNTRPIINFSFTNGKENFLRKKNNLLPEKKEFIKKTLSSEKAKYSFLEVENPNPDDDSFTALRKMFNSLSDSQIKRYNENLDKYFESFESYIDSLYEQKLYNNNVLEINLLIKNNGNKPAEDLDIFIQFPEGLQILNRNRIKQIAKTKPKLPEKPKPSPIDIGYMSSYSPQSNLNKYSYEVDYLINKNNEIHFHTKTVKHNQVCEIDSIYVLYDDISDAQAFQISYKIQVSNLSKQIDGVLNINFE